ncbi:DUF3422 family protein [Undibacterium luofuense]|uniref:DUF3422 family protein n=1 Tax=Undibacterium luofuense TaxID=2828733 RepID=UPI0030EF9D44
MQRRQFIQTMAALAAGSTISSRVMAATPDQPRFLLVFLRGGYDASHLLVPVSSSFYYEARPTIAVAKPSDKPDSAIALNTDWGLHPALRDSMYPLFQRGEVSFIPFAGTEDLSRSHFETQDSIEMGQALNGSRNFHSGFLNRLAAVIQPNQAMQCMSFTDQLPVIFQGDAKVANLALKNPAKMQIDQRQTSLIQNMYQKDRLHEAVTEGFNVRAEVLRELQEEMNSANRNAISTKGFALEAQRIARLMREKYALGFIDIGGWDTHVDQGAGKGALANKFEELGKGLQTFREFNERRLSPAMATCRTTSARLEAILDRVGRTTMLLSTRVNVTREKQNQQVLKSMDRRATMQLRLQQTVEGLSVAAISYYIVGLVGYAAKGIKASGRDINLDLVTAWSIPVVIGLVAFGLYRFRRAIEMDDDK